MGDFITGRFISFTGSKDVGLHINELTGKTTKGQKWIKWVNAEIGGKDGIVVDETADLEVAAKSIVASAFSFQEVAYAIAVPVFTLRLPTLS